MARASDSLPEIDLTSFHEIPSIQDASETPIQNIAYKNNHCGRRFYITGLWGPSAATLRDTSEPFLINTSETIFTAGVAGGVSLERQRGRLRLETEWLQRDYFKSQVVAPGSFAVATNNWSVMANAWRDFMFTKRLGCYGGGGIGGGGMKVGAIPPGGSPIFDNAATAFAWQAGGGLIYELNHQVTFDISYRWYQVTDFEVDGGGIVATDDFDFSANQVMFSLRVFEPLGFLRR